MESINFTSDQKEKAILALKRYRDFLSRLERAIWEDDGAWVIEQLEFDHGYLPPPVHQALINTLYDLYIATEALVIMKLEIDPLTEEFDQLIERMQTPAAKEAARSFMLSEVSIPLSPDDRYPGEDEHGDFLYSNPDLCRGCGGMILPENRRIADGCPCNSARGVNHGLVPKNTCTCVVCDPEQTGSTRYSVLSVSTEKDVNVCEHGDHPAPDGQRFCSEDCQLCESASTDEETGCDNICGLKEDKP